MNKEVSPHIYKNFNSWSAHGQDYIVYNLLKQKKEGYFIELGGYDGISISNTYSLEKDFNWKGICIEADKKLFDLCKKNRNCISVNKLIDIENNKKIPFSNSNYGIVSDDCDNKDNSTITEYHNSYTLIDILDECGSPKNIDYFSFDVEGAEYRILKNFDFSKYKFKIIGVERPKSELVKLLKENNYKYLYDIGGDDFFYHSDFEKELDLLSDFFT